MAKYIVQHRRGSAAQWAEKSTIIPKEGELVIEIDEENFLHKLKIGDGVHTYAELAYLQAGDEIVTQVLNKAMPRVVTVTLDVKDWIEVTCTTDPNLGYYAQTVVLDNITEYSRLDLQPDVDMLAEFQRLNLVFATENKGGEITVYSVGDMPLKTYTMQATIIETEPVVDSEKIIGIPIGIPTYAYTKAEVDNKITSISDEMQLINNALIITRGELIDLNSDVYRKAYIDSKISSVYKYKGSYKDFNAFDIGIYPYTNIEVGYVWNLIEGGTIPSIFSATGEDVVLNPGDNIAVVEKATDIKPPLFDVLSGTVDLSAYSTTEEVSSMIQSAIGTALEGEY